MMSTKKSQKADLNKAVVRRKRENVNGKKENKKSRENKKEESGEKKGS